MELIKCRSYLSKFRGLMFRWPKQGIVLINKKPKKIDLHMLFVFYPIDILFLDENKKIIEIYKRVKPFRLYVPGVKSKYIVELRGITNHKINDLFKF